MTTPAAKADVRPLVLHVIVRFDYGGLENGVVNVVNGLGDRFRHGIVALTESSDFTSRLRDPEVRVYELHKRPGNDLRAHWRLYRLLRRLRPAIVHTRNIGALEGVLVARLAGVRACVHGEHGWDVYDPDGTNPRYRMLRRLMAPLVATFVVVSRDLGTWLTARVGIASDKVLHLCNGVDSRRFAPRRGGPRAVDEIERRFSADAVIVGSVTRFSAIKDPLNLVRAFVRARGTPEGSRLRLVMAGDGPLRQQALDELAAAGLSADAWLPGSRDDVPDLLRSFDVFALGSLREGISNTILEAMSSGLPVVATAVGGNLEIVEDGVTGSLVPVGDAEALAAVLGRYAADDALRGAHGLAARDRVERQYSLEGMLARYGSLYAGLAGLDEERR